MTVARCLGVCRYGGLFIPDEGDDDDDDDDVKFQYAGLNYDEDLDTTVCQCSGRLHRLSERLSVDKCFYPCGGNSTQACGREDSILLYNQTDQTVVEPPPRRNGTKPQPTPPPPSPTPTPGPSPPPCGANPGTASEHGVSPGLLLGAALLALSWL